LPTYAAITESRIEWPSGLFDEKIWDHCKNVAYPIFHFGGTCKMGKDEHVMAVDNRGCVDHAIAPLMVNNHAQSLCSLIVSQIELSLGSKH
jgi:choline dehydrogenase-like flavoprotein